MDGNVIEWQLHDDKMDNKIKQRTNIFSLNNASINSVLATKDESIFIAASDNNIYYINTKDIRRERDKTAEALGDDIQKNKLPKFNLINAGANISQLFLSRS